MQIVKNKKSFISNVFDFEIKNIQNNIYNIKES